MGLVTTLLERRGLEQTFVSNPADWLVAMYGGRANYSGVAVTPITAMQSAAVYACVRVSSDTMGSLPLKLERRLPDGGSEPDPNHPLYEILHDAANPEQTAMEYRGMGQGSLCLRGNAYSEIIRDNGGNVRALWPIHPDRVRVERRSNALVYVLSANATGFSIPGRPIRSDERALPWERVLHVRGLSSDGVLGISPIQYAAEAIGLSLATEAYGAAFFGSGANPGGVIERPVGKQLNPTTIRALREQWAELYGGLNNAHKPAVLEDGMTWKPIGIPNDHAQFLATREYQTGDIARIFGIPGVMIGHDDKTATYASAEQFFLSFVVHHVLPWAVRWEQAIWLKLLTPAERRTHFVRHVIDGLLRGDTLTRAQALEIQARNGVISPDEWRQYEGRNPLPDGMGKQPFIPLNMLPLDMAVKGPAAKPPPDPAASAQRIHPGFRLLLTDAAGRAVRREVDAIRKEAVKLAADPAGWRTWVAQFYARHAAYISEALHVSLETARIYSDDHRAQLLATGLEALDDWEHQAPLNLVALALDGLLEPKEGVAA